MSDNSNAQYTLLSTSTEISINDELSTNDEPSTNDDTMPISNFASNKAEVDDSNARYYNWMLMLVASLICGSLLVGVPYALKSPVSMIMESLQPLSSLVMANTTSSRSDSLRSINQSTQPSITEIHALKSYSERPIGYWTDSGNRGTQFTGFASDHDRYEPLVDLLIGNECGGKADLDYQDFSSLEFLRNQSILMVGDSTDRYLVHYLCQENTCEPRCPQGCEYTTKVLNATYKHFTYPGITHRFPASIGVSSCHIPILNFTITNAMTYSILPERYLIHTYFPYNFSRNKLPSDEPYTYRDFIKQFVKPLFVSPANQSHVAPPIPTPTILTAQTGLWDLMLLTENMHRSTAEAQIDLRIRWWNQYETNMLPILDETFSSAKLKYLRTIPPTKDYSQQLCNEMTSMMRFKSQSLREHDQNSKWHLWDISMMLAECESFTWDGRHYGPHVLNQLFNVLLNDIKAKKSLLS